MCSGAGIAAAQTPSGRIEVSVGGSWLPLSGGNATVGATRAAGLSGRISYRLPTIEAIALEAFYTHAPADDDPYNRVPALTFAGVQVRLGPRPALNRRVTGFVLGGFEQLRVEAEEIVCDPPLCMGEGGARFHDARLAAGLAGAGIAWVLTPRLLLRSDGRVHVPLGASPGLGASGDKRLELSLGFGVLL